MSSIRDSFFDAKTAAALWDVAVSLKRGNALPLDPDSVFKSEQDLIAYIGDKITTTAYPGQIIAVVGPESTDIYYIDQNLDYHLIGKNIDIDNKSISNSDNHYLFLSIFLSKPIFRFHLYMEFDLLML